MPADPGVEGMVPEVGSLPSQIPSSLPEPVQDVAFVVVMVSVVVSPTAIVEGEAVRETVGGGVGAVIVNEAFPVATGGAGEQLAYPNEGTHSGMIITLRT